MLWKGICSFFTGLLLGVLASFSSPCNLSFSRFKASSWIVCSENCLFNLFKSSLSLCLSSSKATFFALRVEITGPCDSNSLLSFLISLFASWRQLACSLQVAFTPIWSAWIFFILSFSFETPYSSSLIWFSFPWIISLTLSFSMSNSSSISIRFVVSIFISASRAAFAFSKTTIRASFSDAIFCTFSTLPFRSLIRASLFSVTLVKSWLMFSSCAFNAEITVCFLWISCWRSLFIFWCSTVTLFGSSCSLLGSLFFISWSAIFLFKWKFSASISLFFFSVAFIKACVEDSSSRSDWTSFSKHFFSDLAVSKAVSLSSASFSRWSHLVCSSCNLHCIAKSSSSVFLVFSRSSLNSSMRRLFAPSRWLFCVSSWSTFFWAISNWLATLFNFSLDCFKSLLTFKTSLSASTPCSFKSSSRSFSDCKSFLSCSAVILRHSNSSCKALSLSTLFWRLYSACLRFSFTWSNSASCPKAFSS